MALDCSQEPDVLSEARGLLSIGLDVIPLKSGKDGKSAFESQWTARPVHTFESFASALPPGGNLGLRTGRVVRGGFLHVVDFDVDAPTPEALAALHELVPPEVLDTCPTAISGNASGARRHYWILTDEPLAKATRGGPWGKIELMGDGQQVALPPSIHPDSGRRYRWDRRPDDLTDLTGIPIAPLIPADRCRAWGAVPSRRQEEADAAPVLTAPTDEDRQHAADLLEDWADDLARSGPDTDGRDSRELMVAYAWRLGQLGAHGLVDRDAVRDRLLAACDRNGLAEWFRSTGKPRGLATQINGQWRRGAMVPGYVPTSAEHRAWWAEKADAARQAEVMARVGELDDPDEPKAEAEKPAALEWFGEIQADLTRRYLAKGLLDVGTLSCVYGASNAGKTFVVLDLAYHVARGLPWGADAAGRGGYRTRKGAVLYLALEGGPGILGRIAAMRQHKGGDEEGDRIPFAVRRAGANLRKPGSPDVGRIVELHKALMREAGDVPSLIVVDTLSRALAGGEENASADMTAFVANVDRIREKTGAHVLIVHHTGKDQARGMRGHSSLLAAVDHEIQVEHDPAAGGMRYITGGKQRDHDRHGSIPFRLVPVTLGTDEDGDPVTSCAVDLKPDLMEDPRVADLPAPGKVAWNELRRLLRAEDGAQSHSGAEDGAQSHSGRPAAVLKAALVEAVAARSVAVADKARREYGHRGIRALRDAGLVTIGGDMVAVTSNENNTL